MTSHLLKKISKLSTNQTKTPTYIKAFAQDKRSRLSPFDRRYIKQELQPKGSENNQSKKLTPKLALKKKWDMDSSNMMQTEPDRLVGSRSADNIFQNS